MVREGWAVAFRRHSNLYVAAEQQAQLARTGIWSGQFERPDAFRAAGRARIAISQRSTPQSRQNLFSTPTNCQIKGNINRRGDRIYHMPGTKWYADTRAEAYFCSEAEAAKAGFRRARTN